MLIRKNNHHIKYVRGGSIIYFELQRKYVALCKCWATSYFDMTKNTWIDKSSPETPKSNIARRDAEQLIDHRSICSGTLDETSLQSLGGGMAGWMLLRKPRIYVWRENTKKIQTLHQFKSNIHHFNGDVSFPDVIRNSGKRTKGNCSKHLQLPNASPAHCIHSLSASAKM